MAADYQEAIQNISNTEYLWDIALVVSIHTLSRPNSDDQSLSTSPKPTP